MNPTPPTRQRRQPSRPSRPPASAQVPPSASPATPEAQAILRPAPASAATLLDHLHTYTPTHISVNTDYLGAGYAILGQPEREAIELFAQTEGLLIDPVYTGRAAAGMIDLIRRGVIRQDETILFWHTGGTPALFVYEAELNMK